MIQVSFNLLIYLSVFCLNIFVPDCQVPMPKNQLITLPRLAIVEEVETRSSSLASVPVTVSFELQFCQTADGLSLKTRSINGDIHHSIFQDDEIVFCWWVPSTKEQVLENVRLFSNYANPNLPTVKPGQIVPSGNLPIGGFIGGYAFEDYFPTLQTENQTVQQDEPFVSSTRYGNAKVWFDIKHPNLPNRIFIEKLPNHIIAGERRVGDLPVSRNMSERFKSFNFDFRVVEFGIADTGEFYFKKSTLELVALGDDGSEFRRTVNWIAKEISFVDVEVDKLDAFSTPEIKDRTKVEVVGAPQLPYIWSAKEQWAVPDERYAAEPVQLQRPTRFYYVAAGVGVLCLAMAVFYWKSRR